MSLCDIDLNAMDPKQICTKRIILLHNCFREQKRKQHVPLEGRVKITPQHVTWQGMTYLPKYVDSVISQLEREEQDEGT
jgi:hypothetical protein